MKGDLQKLHCRTAASRLGFDYIGNASSIDGVESAKNHRVNTEFDHRLSRRFYLILLSAGCYNDAFQHLGHRITAGVCAGYDLLDRPNLNLNTTTGPACQYAWFQSADPAQPLQKGAAALNFGSHFDWDITRRIKRIVESRGQVQEP